MKPKDVLENIIIDSCVFNKRMWPVGSLVLRSKNRELLKKLKSDDIKNIRWPYWR